jgi:hypothetical protein
LTGEIERSGIDDAARAGQPTLIQRVEPNAVGRDQFCVAQLGLSARASALGVSHKLLFGAEYSADRVNFRAQPSVPCGVRSIDALNPVYVCGVPTPQFGFLAKSISTSLACARRTESRRPRRLYVFAGKPNACVSMKNAGAKRDVKHPQELC